MSARVLPAVARLILLPLLLISPVAWPQDDNQSVSARELIEKNQETEAILEEKAESDRHSLKDHSTPLSTMLELREAMRAQDYARAGKYLDRRYLPDDMEQYTDEALIKALAYVWGRQDIFDVSTTSDLPKGNLDDGLPSYRDLIGTVSISSGDVPIYLQHVPDGEGGRIWKLSNATVAKIPEMWEELGYSPVAVKLSQLLPDFRFMGMDNWQLLATVLFFLFAWPLSMLISYLMMRLALLIPNRFPLGIQRFFRRTMRFFLFIVISKGLIDQLGLSLTARILLESSGMNYIAFTVLLLGALSLVRDYQIRKMQYAGNAHYVALLKPFTTIVKVIVVTIIALVWARDAGYDMSTILAGLGVGSLAVALAAQKTLENIIGAITLYTARPVSAGDFCRFGDVTGTVEEIGLRSTQIRTLARSMVVIPNAVFASLEVENFSQRDRIRYYRKFRLLLPGADQLRLVLAEVRKLLLSHPEVLQETVSVRFEDIIDANAVLRIDAGVDTRDYQIFLAVAEDLNLRLMEIVHDAGAIFSGPGQSLQLRELPAENPELQAKFESTLSEWRAQDRLPFPNYNNDEIQQLKGTLDYPPKGSST